MVEFFCFSDLLCIDFILICNDYTFCLDPIFLESEILLNLALPYVQSVSKKRNTFVIEYLKLGSTKLIVLLVGYSVLPHNSIKSNFSFLWLSGAKILSFKVQVWFSRFFIYIYLNWEVILLHNKIILEEFFPLLI